MVVVGAGRVGTALEERARERGVACELVRRGQTIRSPGAIVLAVRGDQLADAVASIPSPRRPDLVLVQNGAIRDAIRALGLDEVTRGVLYLMAGNGPLVAETSFFAGPRAGEVVRWLGALGIPADEVDWERFGRIELEKLLWLAVMGPLCDAHRETVGVVATRRADEVRALLDELIPVGEAALRVRLDREGAFARALAWSLAIPAYRASVKERPLRNGWLRDQARRASIATPLHDRLVPD